MAIDITPDDQSVIIRLSAAIEAHDSVELRLGQLEDAVMDEFARQSLSPVRLALAAAHVAGLVMSAHKLEDPTRRRLQTDLALLLMERFRVTGGFGTDLSLG